MRVLHLVQFFSERKLITLLPECVHSEVISQLLPYDLCEIHNLGAVLPSEEPRSFSCHSNQNASLSGIALPLRKLNELLSGQVRKAKMHKEK